ncbi:hypothetical protein [Archangium sp.]|uniref:hypothetical protein n=1 Tax=Archangium sp. TaxID=1872627 RepID=UPI002D26E5C5|nr:hypothetical protein [Archangium sp.]HYO57337.1 hypothetical protein [Archangium sp.]
MLCLLPLPLTLTVPAPARAPLHGGDAPSFSHKCVPAGDERNGDFHGSLIGLVEWTGGGALRFDEAACNLERRPTP